MGTFNGKLVRVDMGTGGWVLETKDGDKIALFGDVPVALAGRQVVVAGNEVDGAGFVMVGNRIVEIETIRAA